MDEDRVKEFVYSLYSSPRVWWGDKPDEAYLLDLLRKDLSNWEDPEPLEPGRLERVVPPDLWQWYVDASAEDPWAWDMLQLLLRRLGSAAIVEAQEDAAYRDALEPLVRWAVEVAAGLRERKDGPGAPSLAFKKKALRDAMIAATVSDICEYTDRPAVSIDDEPVKDVELARGSFEVEDEPLPAEPKSACGVVAKAIGLSYATVSDAWKNRPPHFPRNRRGRKSR